MRCLARLARQFGRDERGATALEYGLIAGLVAIAMLVALIALGGVVGDSWNATAQRVTDAMGGR